MNELSLMEKFSDPALIDSLSMGDKATGALITTLMGMGTTFIVLIFLWGLIALLAKFTQEKPKGPKAEQAEQAEPIKINKKVADNTVSVTEVADANITSPEIIAVITAAIAQLEGMQSAAGNLIIRKISRVSGAVPAWGNAGGTDAIASRKF